MRNIMVFVCCVSIAATAAAETDAQVLAKLTDAQLADLQTKAQSRIDVIDDYNNALVGSLPEADPQALQYARQTFADASRAWYSASVLAYGNEVNCFRYVENTRRLVAEINSGYKKLPALQPDDKSYYILRARLEAMTFLLLSEIQLSDNHVEGGNVPITGGVSCNFEHHNHWVLATGRLRDTLTASSRALWGERGVQHPYPLSQALLQILNSEEHSAYTWSVARYSIEAAALIIATTFASKTLLPALARLVGARAVSYAKIAGIVGLGSYGGYRGYKYAEQKNRDSEAADDDWHHIQASVEDLVELSPNDTENYYSIALELEKNILQYNLSRSSSLEPDIEQARSRFHTLENAKNLARSKLTEIESEITKRKNVNK